MRCSNCGLPRQLLLRCSITYVHVGVPLRVGMHRVEVGVYIYRFDTRFPRRSVGTRVPSGVGEAGLIKAKAVEEPVQCRIFQDQSS